MTHDQTDGQKVYHYRIRTEKNRPLLSVSFLMCRMMHTEQEAGILSTDHPENITFAVKRSKSDTSEDPKKGPSAHVESGSSFRLVGEKTMERW